MKKAIVIFCEGPHDVAFIRGVFKFKYNLEENSKIKLSEIKNPFGNFLSGSLKKHYMEDISMDMAHRFYLPNLIYEMENNYILVFSSGGETQSDNIKYLISNFENSFKLAPYESSEIESISYIFTFDCDYKTPMEKFESCQKVFSQVKKSDLGVKDFSNSTDVIWKCPNAQRVGDIPYAYVGKKIGFFFWSDYGKPGTLENIYYPIMIKLNSELLEKAESFVDSNFTMDFKPKHPEKPKEVSASKAQRLKAIIACAGQGKNTGAALSSIYKYNKLLDKDSFLENELVQDFISFLAMILA